MLFVYEFEFLKTQFKLDKTKLVDRFSKTSNRIVSSSRYHPGGMLPPATCFRNFLRKMCFCRFHALLDSCSIKSNSVSII